MAVFDKQYAQRFRNPPLTSKYKYHVNSLGELTDEEDILYECTIGAYIKAPPEMLAFAGPVWDIQAEVTRNDARFLMNGMMTMEGRKLLFLSTEFRYPMRDKYFWRRVYECASLVGAYVFEMDRDVVDGEKHVEIACPVHHFDKQRIIQLKHRVMDLTQGIWAVGGNAVF